MIPAPKNDQYFLDQPYDDFDDIPTNYDTDDYDNNKYQQLHLKYEISDCVADDFYVVDNEEGELPHDEYIY